MQLITLDFETYYDKTYSLSKLTTEEYIRDSQFEAIGVAYKINEAPATWVSGGDIGGALTAIDWERSILVAHNAMFDAAILSWRFGIQPNMVMDTLSMSRAIDGVNAKHSLKAVAARLGVGAKGDEVIHALGKRLVDFSPEELARYAEYCKNDAEITFKIFVEYAKNFSSQEMLVINNTIKMFSEPVLELDLSLLEGHLAAIQKHKADLISLAGADSETLQSNPKFAECLRGLGVEPPTKISPRTNKETYAFAKNDSGLTDLLEHENLAVQAVVAARLGVKSTIEETRTERLLSIGHRGVLPVPLRYYAAHTGRWGGSDKVNLQNLPSRQGNVIKQAILAPKGYTLVESDSAQIEARVLAWLAGQTDLVEAFARGDDVYTMMACTIYNKEQEDINKDERFVGKSVVLGSGYGMGAEKFKTQLLGFKYNIELPEAKRIIQTYRSRFPAIKQLWSDGQRCLEGMIRGEHNDFGVQPQAVRMSETGKPAFLLPSGLLLSYPELYRDVEGEYSYLAKSNDGSRIKIYGGKVVENVCQAVARCIISEQLVKISKKYKVVLTVHDSILCVVKDEEAVEAKAYIETAMREPPVWAQELPLNCEAGVGKNYGACT